MMASRSSEDQTSPVIMVTNDSGRNEVFIEKEDKSPSPSIEKNPQKYSEKKSSKEAIGLLSPDKRASFSGMGKNYLEVQKEKIRRLNKRLSVESSLGYSETLMHGHYTTARLKWMIKNETMKLEKAEKKQYLHQPISPLEVKSPVYNFKRSCGKFLTGYAIQDWAFLTLLGVFVALFSFIIDMIVEKTLIAYRSLLRLSTYHVTTSYIAWVLFPVILVSFSTGFTRLVGPTAIGSGIPEVKTIMKGVVLKEYLTFKTLLAKVVGLSASLGSGLPLGKVGPFVHVACVTSSVLSKFFTIFNEINKNESIQIDILTAASAVGVSCTFAAPIGGVLFSVEATASYFAVRNYWRGFYSAVCGAFTFRLLSSITKSEETLTHLFKTDLRQTMPYDVFEIAIFIFVGLISGILGALFVWFHKNIVIFIRGQKKLNMILQKSRFIYPCLITFIIFSLTFPPFLGQFMAGQLTLKEAINQFFDNRTWISSNVETFQDAQILKTWRGPWNNVYLTISFFFIAKFFMCAIATTIPFPCGIFIPSFALGSALGRLIGEVVGVMWPAGIRSKSILPGAYALVGAAGFSGAVTHTVSPAVIVFELTGHLAHLLPCVISTMVAGAVASLLQASVYDALIEIKKLPYLPSNIDPDSCKAYDVVAEDIMDTEIPCIPEDSTYGEIWKLISLYKYKSYPLVKKKVSRVLLGSVLRAELKTILFKHFKCTNFGFGDINEAGEIVEPFVKRYSFLGRPSMANNLDIKRMVSFDENMMNEKISFNECIIDPAPFQISSKTSLYKIHWLFSLLGLHHCYVTDSGKIVGYITIVEVRNAIQKEINEIEKK